MTPPGKGSSQHRTTIGCRTWIPTRAGQPSSISVPSSSSAQVGKLLDPAALDIIGAWREKRRRDREPKGETAGEKE